jgi:hypothetical protein
MSKLRDALKDLTKLIGVYEPIRRSKDILYRKIRDSRFGVTYGTTKLLLPFFPKEEFSECFKEFESEGFVSYISGKLKAKGDGTFGASSEINLRALYCLCRIFKPAFVVETGVASGGSSYVILSALEKNGKGHLYSIDLPPGQWTNKGYAKIDTVALPENKTPGWIVPEKLRHRWTLRLGDAKEELPRLLAELKEIDMFYHDAEHTYEAMCREYSQAWAYLRVPGILCSDDVNWNEAFPELVAETVGCVSSSAFNFGIIRKQ